MRQTTILTLEPAILLAVTAAGNQHCYNLHRFEKLRPEASPEPLITKSGSKDLNPSVFKLVQQLQHAACLGLWHLKSFNRD